MLQTSTHLGIFHKWRHDLRREMIWWHFCGYSNKKRDDGWGVEIIQYCVTPFKDDLFSLKYNETGYKSSMSKSL